MVVQTIPSVTRSSGSGPTAVTNKDSAGSDSRAVPRSGQPPAIASNETREASMLNGASTAHATTEAPDSCGTGFGSHAVPWSNRSEGANTNDMAGTAAARQPDSQLSSRDTFADAEVERVMGQVGHGERFLRHSVQRSQQSQAAAVAPQPPRTASAASGRSSTSIFNRSGNNILKRLSFVENASRPPAEDAASTSQRRPSSPRTTNERAAASNKASVEDDDDSDETGFENVPADYRPASSMSSRPSSVMRRPVILPTFGEPIYPEDESVTRTATTCAALSTQVDDGEDSDETGFEHAPPFKPKAGSRPLPTSSSASSGGRYGNVRGWANDSARPSQSDSNLHEPASSRRPHSVTTVRAGVAPTAGTFPRRSTSQMQTRLPPASVGIEKLDEYRRIIRGILRLRHPDMMLVRDLEGVLHGMEFSRTDLQVRLGMPLREFLTTVPDVDLLALGEHDHCVYRPPENAS
ncbi:hypothetical protein AAVH_11386 [Aphelenchoides avenae]|nr:hypothetical protein AAVH_11386 [Aphelenchus avenae]